MPHRVGFVNCFLSDSLALAAVQWAARPIHCWNSAGNISRNLLHDAFCQLVESVGFVMLAGSLNPSMPFDARFHKYRLVSARRPRRGTPWPGAPTGGRTSARLPPTTASAPTRGSGRPAPHHVTPAKSRDRVRRLSPLVRM